MKRMEEESFLLGLEIIARPDDQNQVCTSSSSSLPRPCRSFGIEKIDLVSLSSFQLEGKIRDYRNLKLPLKDGGTKIRHRISLLEKELGRRCFQTQLQEKIRDYRNMMNMKLPLKDGGAKIQCHILLLEKELARRRSQTQLQEKIRDYRNMMNMKLPLKDGGAKIQCHIFLLEKELARRRSQTQMSLLPNSDLMKGSQGIFNLDVKPSSLEQEEIGIDGVLDLEKSPCDRVAKVCFKCHQSISNGTFQSKRKDKPFCCSTYK